jgi:hypothetical protein
MVTQINILYSVAAVKRLLGLPNEAAVKIRKFFRVIWVWVKGRRPTFISKSKFHQHFVDRRRADAQDVNIRDLYDGSYAAFSIMSGRQYRVIPDDRAIACNCEDYGNQLRFFGRGVCKHGYAVLAHLGYSSLKDYIKVIDNLQAV